MLELNIYDKQRYSTPIDPSLEQFSRFEVGYCHQTIPVFQILGAFNRSEEPLVQVKDALKMSTLQRFGYLLNVLE